MSVPKEVIVAMQEAQRRFAGNDPKGAVHICEQIVHQLPNYPAAHVLLGRAYRQLGMSEQALSRFRSAAELAPKDETRWFEFVDELLKDGQKGRARKVAQKAPLRGPRKKELLDLAKKGRSTSGVAAGSVDPSILKELQDLVAQGKVAEAGSQAQVLLADHPDSAFLHNIRGIAALAEGENALAVSCFQKTMDLSPKFAGAGANLGLAQIRLGQLDAAIDTLKRVLAYEPKSLEARNNLANAYLDAKDFAAAKEEALAVLELSTDDLDGLAILARVNNELEEFDEALSAIDRIETQAGRNSWSIKMRFFALSESGRLEEAIAFAEKHIDETPELTGLYARVVAQIGEIEQGRDMLRRAIELDSEDAKSLYQYSLFTKWTEDDPVLPVLESTAKQAPSSDAFFALGKAQIDLKQYDDGFQSYAKANALLGETVAFRLEDFAEQQSRILNTWSGEAMEHLKGVGVESVSPIFIVGLPRSGSTLLDSIISSHPAVSSTGEDTFANAILPFDIEPDRNRIAEAARLGAAEVRRLSGSEGRLLDKYLNNFMRVGSLAAAFPNARFIQTYRDPRSIALSIFTNALKTKGHPYSTDLVNIAKYYLLFHRYMEHWKAVLGDRVIVSDYKELVEDPEPTIRSLIDWLGLPWDEACLHPEAVQNRVKTLSVAQVRSGIHAGSVERWKRHEHDLEPFSEVLREAGLLPED